MRSTICRQGGSWSACGRVLLLVALLASLSGFAAFARASTDASEIQGLVARRPERTRSGGVALDVDAAKLQRVSRSVGPIAIRDLPLADGSSESFTIQRFEVFTANASIVETDGTTQRPIGLPAVALFQGSGIGNPAKHLILSVINENELWAMVRDGSTLTTLIGPTRSEGTPAHELGNGEALDPELSRPHCDGAVVPPEQFETAASAAGGALRAPRAVTNDTLEVELLVDVGYQLLSQRFGDPMAAATYVALLHGTVAAIYQRDVNVVPKLQTLVIWTSQEPFDGANTGEQLQNYATYNFTYRSGMPRDLAHYLNGHGTFGGRAYIDTLCSSGGGSAVSNIWAIYTFPVVGYAWDVDVVAHEMGHNFGSPHTHCYVPPIDKCYNQEPGCYNGPVDPTVGEIMSYCHLVYTSKQLGFGGRVGSLMRSRAEGASCLQSKSAVCGDRVVDAGEECDDGNSNDSDCCTSNCELQSSGPGVCEDFQFCTENYACPNATCYQQMRSCDDGNPCTVDSCDEVNDSCVHWSRDYASCDDGLYCTVSDICLGGVCGGQPRNCGDDNACTGETCDEATDTCVSTALPPANGCRTARKTQLKMKQEGTKRSLMWKWADGDATNPTELGYPLDTTHYSLCIYDQGGQLVSHARAPSGGICGRGLCWKPLRKGGYKYSDRAATPDGLTSATLKPGLQDAAAMLVKGKGALLTLPSLPIGAESLRVQLRKSDGNVCWESEFAPPFRKDDGVQFQDTAMQ